MPPRMNTCAQNTFKYTHACLPLITCDHVILPFTISLGDYFLTNSLRSISRKYISTLKYVRNYISEGSVSISSLVIITQKYSNLKNHVTKNYLHDVISGIPGMPRVSLLGFLFSCVRNLLNSLRLSEQQE